VSGLVRATPKKSVRRICNMRKYITKKGLIFEISSRSISVADSLGNSSKTTNKGKFYINKLLSKYNDKLLLEFDDELNDYSVVINNSNLYKKLDGCIQLCSNIEYLLIQRSSDVIIDDLILLDIIQSIVETENLGLRLNKDRYEKILHRYDKVKNLYCVQQHVRYLFELVRSEIYHAESCVKEIVYLFHQIIKEKKDEINDKEIIYTGLLGDKVGWYVTDCVKALATSLDGLSKILHYIDDYRLHRKVKKPKVLFSDLVRVKKFKEDTTFKQYLNELNELFLLRHDLTHNQLFYPVRQRVFIGSGKTPLNSQKFAYADILIYDFKDGCYTRALGIEGFFSMKRDTISFLQESIHKVYNFFHYCISSVYDELINEAKESNIESFWAFDHAKAGLKLNNRDYYMSVIIE
jgi:hypothetical protein